MVEINQSVDGAMAKADTPVGRSKTLEKPTPPQLRYLQMGASQPGGKLPLFDENGQEIKPATIRSCVEKGWAEPWFNNPIKPNWLVCKLTEAGRKTLKK